MKEMILLVDSMRTICLRGFYGLVLGGVIATGTSGCLVTKWMPSPQPPVKLEAAAFEDPGKILNSPYRVYMPEGVVMAEGLSEMDRQGLLRRAPILVHESGGSSKKYEPEADLLGQPVWTGKGVEVDVSRPVIFTRVGAADMGGEMWKQYIYAYWYPRHPIGGIQKGHVDGAIVRVTEDGDGRMAVVEWVMSCGCYHGTFVGEHVEDVARNRFGEKEKGARYHVERRNPGEIAWEVRDLIRDAAGSERPVLFLRAGSHFCEAIQGDVVMKGWRDVETVGYSLKGYEALERLDGGGSLFGKKGLVPGGRRWGEEIFFPTLDHPGWPRHMDLVEIHWDEGKFMDPGLLAHHLKLGVGKGMVK